MDELSFAPVNDIKFDIETQIEDQLILRPNFAPGLDKIGRPYCNLFSNKMCKRDALCPLKHFRFEKVYVCRHWLRGMCRKGDDCESFHEYDDKRMPQCYFYQKYGHCSNSECPFIHAEMESLQRPCPYYMRGFCSSGPNCKFKHIKLSMCPKYYAGFCPQGPHCEYGHPKFEIISFAEIQSQRQAMLVCHACNEPGHKSTACPLVQMYKEKARLEGNTELANLPAGKRPLELVTCFKCRARGHYANKCPYSSSEVAKGIHPSSTAINTTQ